MPFIGVQPASALLTSADIQDGQITTAKLADTAVTTAKITDDAVTGSKIENSPTIANGITLTDGDLTVASGHGINFASASGDSGGMTGEIFADYEEGTFTPSVEGNQTAGTATYISRSGRYKRVGNFVHTTFHFSLSGHTGSGTMLMKGIPYTVANSVEFTGTCMLNNYNTDASIINLVLYANTGNDYLRIYATRDNASWLAQDLDSVSALIGSFSYHV